MKRAKLFALLSGVLATLIGLVYITQILMGNTRAGSAILAYKGVNLAGADFGSNLPGTYNSDYTYPTHAEVDYYLGKGMNTFRVPFRWERLQHAQFAALDATELARLNDLVTYATGRGATVLLDPHNYARYYNNLVGSAVPNTAFADFWQRLAGVYKNNSRVIFGLVNEPHDLPTEQWLGSANAAIAAIRSIGANNLIFVPGNAWTGAHSWSENWYGTANAVAMLGVVDPANNYAYEVHQYLDGDSSGTSDSCVSATIGSQRLASFTNWLHQHGKRGFLGEFGGGRNSTCNTAVDDMLTYIDHNADVWLGWTWWAGGPWWGDYIFTLEPNGSGDRPQWAALTPHLGGVSNPNPTATATPTTKPATPTATPTNPTATPTTAPGQPTATPKPPTSGGVYGVSYKLDSVWGNGYNISLSVVNNGGAAVQGWTVSWTLSKGETLANAWNANCTVSGQTITCKDLGYNSTLGANGGSTGLGAQFNSTGGASQPTSFVINGVTVGTGGGGNPSPTATAALTATPKPQPTNTPQPTSVPPTSTPKPTATSAPQPTATTAPQPGGQYAVQYKADSTWSTGYVVNLNLTNNGSIAVKGWTVSWTLANGETIANAWNAACTTSGQTVTCRDLGYNANLGVKGGSTTFGLQFNTAQSKITRPTTFKVNSVIVQAS